MPASTNDRSSSWTYATEQYRHATRADIPAFAEMLADPEVGRWLWFTPISADEVAAYFGPLLDQQAQALAAGETGGTAIFVVEDLHGKFLGQGAAVAVAPALGDMHLRAAGKSPAGRNLK